jgi:uncharacterized Tic20 family protein
MSDQSSTSTTNTVGVIIAVLLLLILVVLISGFGFWKEFLIILGVVLSVVLLLFIAHFLRSALEIASFAATHTAEGKPRENTRWPIALRSLYKQHRTFVLISLISLLLVLSVFVKYMITGRWE